MQIAVANPTGHVAHQHFAFGWWQHLQLIQLEWLT
jgi:hypothetical protein